MLEAIKMTVLSESQVVHSIIYKDVGRTVKFISILSSFGWFYDTYINENVDIQFSAHDAFME
jgi:hypothetical protein